jgi:hypothetical protein
MRSKVSNDSHNDRGSGDPAELIGAFVLAAIIVYGLAGAAGLGQHVYEETHHVHISRVSGDWGSLFLNIGLAVVSVGSALLFFLIAVLTRRSHWAIMGLLAIVCAFIFGAVLAPHFAGKVSGETRGTNAHNIDFAALRARGHLVEAQMPTVIRR